MNEKIASKKGKRKTSAKENEDGGWEDEEMGDVAPKGANGEVDQEGAISGVGGMTVGTGGDVEEEIT